MTQQTMIAAARALLASHLPVFMGRQRHDVHATRIVIIRTLLIALIAAFAIAANHPAHAQAAQSLDAIRAAATKAVLAQLPQSRGKYFLSAGALDSRLQLAPCGSPLDTIPQSAGNASSRMTIGVRCATGNQWTIYVPVTIAVELPVLVLQRNLARDARVTADDIQLQTKRVSGSGANFVSDTAALQGRHLKRALTVGSTLTHDALVADVLVRRGQQVTLLAQTGSIEIRAQGQALTEGGISDRIRVQNVNSHRVVEGVVENGGTVRVEL